MTIPPLLLQCLYLLILTCAALFAYLFPAVSEQLFDCLPWSEQLQPLVGASAEFRYRLVMWLAGSAAVPVFTAILLRCGFDVVPAQQPRALKKLGWLFFGTAPILLLVCWFVSFVMIFVGPVWVQFEPFYALMLIGIFTFINAYLHLVFLKIRSFFRS